MAQEIEKKFLVTSDSWRLDVEKSLPIRQAYLANTDLSSIRIRIIGPRAQINIKSGAPTISREEYEYPIPIEDAEEMVATMCPDGEITKTRHHIRYADKLWEIDEFHDTNAGLVIAEIELQHENEPFEGPPWLGREVSHLPSYYNPSLLKQPYSSWPLEEHQKG